MMTDLDRAIQLTEENWKFAADQLPKATLRQVAEKIFAGQPVNVDRTHGGADLSFIESLDVVTAVLNVMLLLFKVIEEYRKLKKQPTESQLKEAAEKAIAKRPQLTIDAEKLETVCRTLANGDTKDRPKEETKPKA